MSTCISSCPLLPSPRFLADPTSEDSDFAELPCIATLASASKLSIQQERDQILAEIEFHRKEIATLYEESNAFSKTTLLPPVVLLEIFRWAVTDTLEDGAQFSLSSIIHTCKRWRSITIEHPPLWSHIAIAPQSNKEWIETMITNSKHHPLTIRAQSPKAYKRFEGCIKAALAEMKRIKDLRLSLPPTLFHKIKRLLDVPSPLLRSINLESTAPVNPYRGVPILQFFEQLPCLREIRSSLPVSAISRTAQSTVTTLHIDHHNLVSSSAQNWSFPNSLLHVLEKMPSLEQLFIRTKIDSISCTPRQVNLSRLNVLEVHGHENFHDWLLGLLHFPSHTFVRLHCGTKTISFPAPVPCSFAIACASHWAEYPYPMGGSAKFMNLVHHSLLDSSAQVDPCTVPATEHGRIPIYEATVSPFVPNPERILRRFRPSSVQVLSLSQVPSLPHPAASPNPFGTLWPVLRKMRGVKTLILDGWKETCVATALEVSVDWTVDGGYNEPNIGVFPMLETLVLRNVLFGVDGIGSDGFFRSLRIGIQNRAQFQIPVQRLIIESAVSLYREDVLMLRQDVMTLWDEELLDA